MRRARAISGVRARPRGQESARPPWLPPLNALHAFEAAGRRSSFKNAAAELCVTPSAVSRQIKLLEAQLGVALFVREGNALTLTSAGARYLDEVQRAFAALERGTAEVKAQRGGAVVRLGCVQALAANWIVPRLGTFIDRHADLELQLVTSESLSDVSGGEVDLAIRFGQGRWPGVACEPLLDLDLFPVVAPPLAKTIRTPRDVLAHRWLHLTLYPRAFRDWLAAAGVPDGAARENLSFDGADLVFRAAAAGLGVAMASTVLVQPYIDAKALVRLFLVDATVAGQYHLLYRADEAQEPRVAAVREFVHRLARER